jgi:cupin-like protein
VLRGGARSWPAYQKWSFDWLRDQGRHVVVDCEVRNAVQAGVPKVRMTFADYLEQLVGGGLDTDKTYLSVFDICEALPALRHEFDLTLFRSKKVVLRKAWIGPAGTVSGFHFDHADNLFAQIAGQKRFRVVSPDQSYRMYRGRKYDFGTDCSAVDHEHLDVERHPDDR